jgi:hypothetical protein
MLLHGSFTGSYRGQANFLRLIKIYIAGCDIKVSPDQIGLAKGAAREGEVP